MGGNPADSGMTEPRTVATFSEYNELLDGLRARVAELNVAGHTIDHVGGLPVGFTQKVLGPRQVRRIGMLSLGAIFGALGLKGQLVEDPEAFARVAGRLNPRKMRTCAVQARIEFSLTRRFYRKIGRIGGRLSRSKMSKKRASELGRRAAMARWGRGNGEAE
jgi:hypothetical protein